MMMWMRMTLLSEFLNLLIGFLITLSTCFVALIIIQILGTGFFIIFYNLGHRQPGEASAYSVFNEDFRELPGTLNADRLDRDIRRGQL